MKTLKTFSITILFIFPIIFMLMNCKKTSKEGITLPIVGKWEYIKSVQEDGKETFDGVAFEHYYEDGTFSYHNMFLNSVPLDSAPTDPVGYKNLFTKYDAGFGTYTVDNKNNAIVATHLGHTNPENIGKVLNFPFKFSGDTLIFWDKHYFVRVE